MPVAGTGALVLLSACGTAVPTEDERPAEGWSFSDGAGNEVTLDEHPQRVVAYSGVASALWDYGYEVVGVFGPVTTAGGQPDPQIGDVDTERVEVISETYGEMSVEKLASLEPDLIVTHAYDDLAWYLPEEVDQIEAVAPLLRIQVTGAGAEELLADHLDLAVALGADPHGEAVAGALHDFDASLAELSAATEDRPALKVVAVSASPENLYVANAAAGGDLELFAEHGVRLPETDAPDTDQFEELSWEEADKYPADLLLQDSRPTSTPLADLADQPTWRTLPAVEAGQVGAWAAETPYSYTRYAEVVRALAADISEAEPLEH
ncbi:siderophore-binding protein DesE [Marinactinospora endophytica]